MLLEDFLHETRSLSVAHLYFHEPKLTLFENAKQTHPHFLSFNLEEENNTPLSADILFIEVAEASKEKLKRLVSILGKYKPTITYLFAEDVENRLLLKFALHFNVTDVLPLINEEHVLLSIFSQNPTKLDEKLYTFQKIELEKKIEHFFPFFLFQGKHLLYANAKAEKLYETTHLVSMQEKIHENEDLYNALESNEDAQGIIYLHSRPYMCLIKCFAKNNEKLLTLIGDMEEEERTCSSMLNRFDFVDMLKDRLAQQSVTQTAITLTFVNIANLEKLSKSFKGTALHDAFKNLLQTFFQLKETWQELVQWSPSLYIFMSEKRHFEETCKQANYIQKELFTTHIHEKISPIIVTSVMDIKEMNLNNLIEIIEKINTKTLTTNDTQNIDYYEVEYLENISNENEQISYLMHHCFNNKIPIKLLNIYKGLCINTAADILKISHDSYHISCENLQAYVMQLEGQTVLQASSFPKDIKAEVSFLDIKKSFAIIKNLSFLHNSANNRQHTRVQTSFRTPIVMKYARHASAQGEIVDISVNSIAMRIKKLFREEELKGSLVHLNFSLPNETGEYGYVVMDIEAKITYIAQRDTESTKIVVMLENLPKPYSEYLLQYMYTRQKELITEIKRATKAYH
ncbi:pilus biosynthesis protein PilZ [Sulfurospirillum barnesii]|uniref:PilZ domain-containing protein n=1 Tax=Sulfurospirillum barnesii (strain ATCC 700032 / DSM 10660 / SES-3) TaxID=760154 RepID=I3XXE2_SULBS|nr:pilus biosynthesis protein PilZ [Sulfurospirillum barnesii]AFL68616.1 PilZ domain-containing protein [Sulfurospirillum barnesii SES-3]